MSSINSVSSSDPLDDDSMDPNDPNSIMYDPTIAEQNATVVVGPKGQVVVLQPLVDKNSDEKDPIDVDSKNNVNSQNIPIADQDDVGKKLRRFNKVQGH